MKKRHSISQRKCEQGLVAFYGYIAEMCNIEITEKSTLWKLRMVLSLRVNKWQVLH